MIKESLSVLILDASAFFIAFPVTEKVMTVPGVVSELKDIKGKARFEVLTSMGLVVSEPTLQSVKKVKEASIRSGDGSVLSQTDIEVIALALDVHGTICSDDFALQNTAQYLDIQIHPLLQKKAEMRRWVFRCSGCGKYYDLMPVDMTCQICGLKVRRKNK
ncbi:MAG: nucleotide-binding protein [Methanomicrobiales archaeon]|nr:nucleotide-binding protein [Methanomicrobiales archaeon]